MFLYFKLENMGNSDKKETVVKNLTSEQREETSKEMLSFLNHGMKGADGYVVDFLGNAVDKKGKTLEDVLLLSVSSISTTSKEKNEVVVKLQAVSETARAESKKPVVNLPELIYESVSCVAETKTLLKKSKTKKEFNLKIKKYRETLEKADELVSLFGFEMIEDHFTFKGGKVIEV